MSYFIAPDAAWTRERASYNAEAARDAERDAKELTDAYENLANLIRGVLETFEYNDPWPLSARRSFEHEMRVAIERIDNAKASHA